MLIVVAMDAFQAIPFAYLRYKKRPVKFAALKLLFIFASIVLNIAYFVGMKGENVGVAFAINLACTSLVMLCMWKIGGLQICARQGVVAAYAALFFPDSDSGYCRNLKSGS